MRTRMHTDFIFKYFPELTERQKEQIEQMEGLYREWNSRINVISRKDMDNFYLHHVLHSLAIAKLISFQPGTKIMDAGTGGGFPGIPLAILFPETEFYLADSIGKKIKVVREVSRALGLENVEAEQIRAEEAKRSFDFVVSRAVTDLEVFTQWTLRKVQPSSFNSLTNGILYLKGVGVDEEINRVRKLKKTKVFTYPLGYFFKEDFFKTKQVIHVCR
ncbi:16S rRNA (guanine(527)-N(7))-methyltransferase [hydrothermal vent metagenome]|uniref:16S rRNA (Guanine(527)-N(7))-methyltransferase n=1 Tax=hydrothermal vent metagenome TaxID=652676 RepID=A0A3B0URG4_9ZZZZ